MTMIFGVLRAINFAHGEYYMVGTFAAWYVIESVEATACLRDRQLGVVIAAVIAAMIGRQLVMQRLVGAPFTGRRARDDRHLARSCRTR